jgi:ornithine carbamoyltransferase
VLVNRHAVGQTKGVNLTYIGDGNNVAGSLAEVAAVFGANFRIATPPGYGLSEDVLDWVGRTAEQNGATV